MQYAGIDLATLKRLIRQSGLSARELSLRLDRGQGYIGDLLNGRKNPETVEVGPMHQLAVILNSTDFLGLQLEDEPKSVWECCPARWSLFSVPEAATAESWLTYTRCAYTYFFPRPMREWFQRFAYRKLGWGEEAIDEYTRGTQAFSDSHLDYHRKAKSVHRLLVQESIFRNAAIEEPEWLRAIGKTMQSLDGRLIVSLTPDEFWPQVKRTIAKYCEWTDPCTIDVIGKTVVIVRPNCGSPHMVSRDPDTVAAIQLAIELTNPASEILDISHKKSIASIDHLVRTTSLQLRTKRPR